MSASTEFSSPSLDQRWIDFPNFDPSAHVLKTLAQVGEQLEHRCIAYNAILSGKPYSAIEGAAGAKAPPPPNDDEPDLVWADVHTVAEALMLLVEAGVHIQRLLDGYDYTVTGWKIWGVREALHYVADAAELAGALGERRDGDWPAISPETIGEINWARVIIERRLQEAKSLNEQVARVKDIEDRTATRVRSWKNADWFEDAWQKYCSAAAGVTFAEFCEARAAGRVTRNDGAALERSVSRIDGTGQDQSALLAASEHAERWPALVNEIRTLAKMDGQAGFNAKGTVRSIVTNLGKLLRQHSWTINGRADTLNSIGAGLSDVLKVGDETYPNGHTAALTIVQRFYFALWAAADLLGHCDVLTTAATTGVDERPFDLALIESNWPSVRKAILEFPPVDDSAIRSRIARERARLVTAKFVNDANGNAKGDGQDGTIKLSDAGVGLLLDQINLGPTWAAGNKFPISTFDAKIVRGDKPSVCPKADRHLPTEFLPQVASVFSLNNMIPPGHTIHWVGSQSKIESVCTCYMEEQSAFKQQSSSAVTDELELIGRQTAVESLGGQGENSAGYSGETRAERAWLTVAQAEKLSGINKGTLSRAVDAREIRSNGKSGRERRIDAADFTRWQLKRADKPEPQESIETVRKKLRRVTD